MAISIFVSLGHDLHWIHSSGSYCPQSHASLGVSAHRESVHVHAQVAGNRHAGRSNGFQWRN